MFGSGIGRPSDEADIESARSIDDIARVLASMAEQFGFREYSIYDDLPVDGARVQPLRIISSLPASFHSGLDAINANGGDDFLDRVWKAGVPGTWDLTTARSKPNPVFAEALVRHFERYSISCGINIPVTTQRGHRRVISFTGHRDSMSASEIESLHYLAIILINRFEDIETDLWNREGETINDLERSFLQLYADGIDSDQLADQFHLSPSTISFILESARRKLGCISVTHAVAEGFRRGIIV